MTEVLFNPAHQIEREDQSATAAELLEQDRERILHLGDLGTRAAVMANYQATRPFNHGDFPASQTANID